MPMDEFDQPYVNVMERAKAKAAETWKDAPAQAAPRRPTPMLNERQAAQWAGTVALVLGLGAIFAVSIFWGAEDPAAPQTFVAPTQAQPAAQPPAPTIVSEPTPAPLPTGYIVGTEPAPAQLAPAPPAPVYVEPPVVYSELQPIPTEPAGWHPPYASGYSPTENFVEVRP